MNQIIQFPSSRAVVRRQMLLIASSFVAAGSVLAIPARGAQLVEVDAKPLAEAYRASKLIGASVVNDKNEKIGSVDDLIVTPADRVLFAVISVGFRTSFGLPKTDVLKRLQNSGVHVYRTDLNGAVTFYLDGHSVTPSVAALQ